MGEAELRAVLRAIDGRIRDAEINAARPTEVDRGMWECVAHQLREVRKEVVRIAQRFESVERLAQVDAAS